MSYQIVTIDGVGIGPEVCQSTVAEAVLRTLAQAKEEGDPNAFMPEVVTRLLAR